MAGKGYQKRRKQHDKMKKIHNNRTGLIHLYDPKKEGLGPYDINYINAYKKNMTKKYRPNTYHNERNAA